MEETKYLYQVNPRVPMVLQEINFRSPKSAMLTKEDIIKALPKAVIFRRFPNKIEKVTTLNLDRLHNEKYMTEEEYDAFMLKSENKRGQVEAPKIVEVPETPAVTPVVKEEVKEEPKIGEVPEVSVDQKEETVKVEEEVPAAVSEPAAEEVTKEIKLTDRHVPIDDIAISLGEDEDNNSNNYNKKNKKHH